jgi:predicted ATPase
MAKNDIDVLRDLLSKDKMEPFIRHIRFPRYKNLVPDTKIDFSSPITALVGANGTNKSSILRALQGAPGMNNLGMFWFSTSVDPIEETGGERNAFIYGYHHASAGKLVEVLKTRVKKQSDPDYWEPSRRLAKYGMDDFPGQQPGNANKTRWDTITKETIYIDFRQSLSAYDKHFYHNEPKRGVSYIDRKATVRRRSPRLLSAILSAAASFSFFRRERIIDKTNRALSAKEVAAISEILGRKYTVISWTRHFFFNVDGYTCVMKTGALKYSEAFAGSGEFAVARLVVDLMAAKDASLILLDEPEVSLHPGAQERLLQFLIRQVKEKKHQVVMATHSPAMIRALPADAIKVFAQDKTGGQIKLLQQHASPNEAFFHLGEPLPGRRNVIVEDGLAKEIVHKVIRAGGEAYANQFEVRVYPGGATTLWQHFAPGFAAENRKDVLILLDGDQRPSEGLPDPGQYGEDQNDLLRQALMAVAKTTIKFNPDGNPSSGADAAQRNTIMRDFIKWARSHIDYLPGDKTPEGFIWTLMPADENSKKVSEELDFKEKFLALSDLEYGKADFESSSSTEILHTQVTRLTKIDIENASLKELRARLDKFAEQPL